MKRFVFLFLTGLMMHCGHPELEHDTYDVVIYGSTPAGMIAGINLAQKGKEVLIVSQGHRPGGMYTGGLMTSEAKHLKTQCISGLAREFYMRVGEHTPEGFFHNFKPGDPAWFFECKGAEKTFNTWIHEYREEITILYDARLTGLSKQNHRIKSIILNDSLRVSASYFADCSYVGDLMARAGVQYTVGRESRDTYNESFAGIRFQPDTLFGTTVDRHGKRLPFFRERGDLEPGDASDCVTACNYRCILTQKDDRVRFSKPEYYDPDQYFALADYLKRNPDTKLNDLFGVIPRGNGKTSFNTRQRGAKSISIGLLGMQCEYPDANDEKRDRLRRVYERYTKGLYYFLSHNKNVPKALRQEMSAYGYASDEFVDNAHFPYEFYVREARRMLGETIFTQHDVVGQRSKQDGVALGSHWIDSHSVQRIALSDTSYINEGNIWHKIIQPYEIPYRIMLPKQQECTNLLVPVCVSASHVGFCSIRVEPTWMQLGHAAGTALALALESESTVQDLDIRELQALLEKEGVLYKLSDFYQ